MIQKDEYLINKNTNDLFCLKNVNETVRKNYDDLYIETSNIFEAIRDFEDPTNDHLPFILFDRRIYEMHFCFLNVQKAGEYY